MASKRAPVGRPQGNPAWWPVALVIEVVVCWLVSRHLHGGWLMILVCLVAAEVTVWPLTLAHELGHAAVAWVVRLPLTEISTFAGPRTPVRRWLGVNVRMGFLGSANHVRVDVLAQRRPRYALRYVLTLLGGPAANLILAAVLWLAYRSVAEPSLARAVLLIAAVAAALLALFSLLPIRSQMAAPHDGWQAIAWTFQPGRADQRARALALIRRENQARRACRPIDRGVIEPLLASPDSVVAAFAATLLLEVRDQASRPELLSNRGRLSQVAQARGVPRRLRGLVIMLLLDALIEEIIDDPPPDLVADGIALAELGQRLLGYDDPYRTALALLRVWQGEPLSARYLLRQAHRIRSTRERATALAVHALAECELGEIAEARQLATAAQEAAPTAGWVATLTAQVAKRTATDGAAPT